jgi:hypothetical protein
MTTTENTSTVIQLREDRISSNGSFRSSGSILYERRNVSTSRKFASCVELIASGRHMSHAGLADIVEIMQTMNRKKPRHELIRILRDYTPETLDRGS